MGSKENLSKILGNANWDDGSDLMVIGIDFGTTNSGVAWATVADFKSRQINVILNWPGRGGDEGKTPTELFYGDDGEIRWGYDIPPDAEPLQWFKLLLLKEEDLNQDMRASQFLKRGRRFLKETGKCASDLVTDYLRLIWGHVLHIIKKTCGETVVDALRFHVVITVPAIWKSYARQEMTEAIGRSGILDKRPAGDTKFTFAPEPEAAALSTLCEQGRKINTDEVYVICDAGGGTVDLISYKVDHVQPIAMSEAVEGTGDLCGGIFIDEAFEEMCRSRLGAKWARLSRAGIKDVVKGEWEHDIKPQFKDPNSEKEYILRVPAEAFKTSDEQNDTSKEPVIKNGRIHFNGSHIVGTFQKSVLGIEKLINEQIDMAERKYLVVTGIILVGGLGASLYLYECLKEKYAGKGIRVLQSGGINPRTAICRGAVFKGFIDGLSAVGEEWPVKGYQIEMPIKVTSTISRASYGIKVTETYEEGRHSQEDKYLDEDEDEWKARNQMKWYLKKGDNVSKLDTIRNKFYANLTSFTESYAVRLLQCEEAVPPPRKTSAVKNYAEFNCSLSNSDMVDWSSVKGKKMKRLHFELEMIPSGASMDFRTLCNGRVVGEKDVAISFSQGNTSRGKGDGKPCHYDANCINTNCVFQHSVGPCHRGVGCTNTKCRYRHPKKTCQFGSNCRNKDNGCVFRHTSSSPKDPEHLSGQRKRSGPEKARRNRKTSGADP